MTLVEDMAKTLRVVKKRPRIYPLVTPCCGVKPLPMKNATHECVCGITYRRLASLVRKGKET